MRLVPRRFAVSLVSLAVMASPFVAGANAGSAALRLHGRADEGKQAESRAEYIPDAMLKLKGKKVRFLYYVGEQDHYDNGYLSELLQDAGAKVEQINWLEFKNVAGDVLVMGEPMAPERVDDPSAIDEERFSRAENELKNYLAHRKQIAADAADAGVVVVPGDKVREFFGLDEKTDAQYPAFHSARFRAAVEERRLPEVQFNGVGFSDVMDFYRDITGLNIFVDWRSLEAAGIDRNAPVTLKLRNVPAGKCLQLTLDSIAPAGTLTYTLNGGVVTISTARDIADNLLTKVYDIHFLLPDSLEPAARDKRVAAMMRLITASVDPSSWGAHGGMPRTAMELKGQLIVVQNAGNQKAVESLLGHLQELIGEKR